MLYFINWDHEVEKEEILAQIIHSDKCDVHWQFLNSNNAFYIKFLGPSAFSEKYFTVKVNEKTLSIRNTNHMMYKPGDFEVYYTFRGLVLNGYTEDVWRFVEDLLINRLNKDTHILTSELF